MRPFGYFLAVFIFAAVLSSATSAGAVTRTWAAAANANWNVDSSWSGNSVPTSSEDVVFNATKSTNCTITADVKVASITINGYTGTIAESGTQEVEVTGNFSQSTGTFTAPTHLIVGGTFNYDSPAVFTPGTKAVILHSASDRTHTFGGVGLYKLVVSDGLLAYYRFGSAGTSATDSSGYTHNLTSTVGVSAGSTTFPPTVFLNPYYGTFIAGSNLRIASHPARLKPTRWTLAAWVRPTSVEANGGEVVSLGDDVVMRVLNTTGKVHAYGDGLSVECDSAISVLDSTWHHIATSYTGTALNVYVDGELSNSCMVTGTLVYTAGTDEIRVGSSAAVATTDFIGDIDEVRIYDRALAAAEIEALALGAQPAAGGGATHTASESFSTTQDVILNVGTFAYGTSTITVGGSWWNMGAAVTGTGLVTFNTTGTGKSLRSNGQRFTSITYDTASGGVNVQDPLYATTLTLGAGTLTTEGYPLFANTFTQATGTLTTTSSSPIIMESATTGTLTMSTTPPTLRVEDPTESNLVGYWKFDRFSGNTSPDSSASGNTATLLNGVVSSTTIPTLAIQNQHSIYLDGDASASTADYVSVGTTNMPASNAAQTICLWTRFPSHAETMNFISLRADAADDGIQIGIHGADDSIRAWKPGGTALVTNGGAAITNDAWHHICYSYDGSTTHRLYIDGGTPYTGTTAPDAVTPDQVLFGAYDTTTTQRFKGYLDEIRIYNVKLSDAEIASLFAGRYPGRGGTGTTTLGGAVTATSTLMIDSGTLATGAHALSLSATGTAGAVDGGGLTINGGSATFSGGLTVRGPGILTMDTTGGTLNIASGKDLIIDGTLTTTTGTATTKPTIKSVSGTYDFIVGSATTATPILNINGLIVKNTTSDGMYINQAGGATATTISRFDNVDFRAGTTDGSHLKIYSQQGIYHFNNLTFDSDVASMTTDYAVHLTGNGGTTTATETRAVVGNGTCTNAAAACESTYEVDDDATEDGLGDNTGGGGNGAVVQWIYRNWGSVSGTIEGFPSAAFDWSDFTFWRTYVAYNNINGTTTDRLYVRNAHGDALYYVDLPNSENFIGTPRWTVETNHYVYAVTTAGRVYKWLDDGDSLDLVAGFPYKMTSDMSASTATSPLGLNSTDVFWAGLDASGNKSLFRMKYDKSSVTVSGAEADISTVPAINSSYIFFAGDGTIFRRTAASLGGSTSFTVTGGLVDGRASLVGSLIYFMENDGTLWALNQSDMTEAWHYQDTVSSGHTCSNDSNCSAKNLYFDFGTLRIYYGDKDGHVYAVNATTGAKIDGYPIQPGSSSDQIVSAPLYRGGLIIVGTTTGKVFVINAANGLSSNNPTLYKTYVLGTSSSVSSVSFEGNTNSGATPAGAYMVGTSDGRLFYLPALNDPG